MANDFIEQHHPQEALVWSNSLAPVRESLRRRKGEWVAVFTLLSLSGFPLQHLIVVFTSDFTSSPRTSESDVLRTPVLYSLRGPLGCIFPHQEGHVRMTPAVLITALS